MDTLGGTSRKYGSGSSNYWLASDFVGHRLRFYMTTAIVARNRSAAAFRDAMLAYGQREDRTPTRLYAREHNLLGPT